MKQDIPANAVRASPSRLNSGHWCHTSNRQLGEGDIYASYSADLIGMEDRIRKPFQLRGLLCVTVAIMYRPEVHIKAYRLVEPSDFSGTPTTYKKRCHSDARQDSYGFYHGVAIKHGKKTYILAGSPIIIAASEETEPMQQSLF